MISPVENHPLCRKDKNGVPMLPNESSWLSDLLTMFVAYSVLKEGDTILRPSTKKNLSQHEVLAMLGIGTQPKMPQLPSLLQQLMSPHATRKAPDDERGIRSEKEIAKMKANELEKKKAVMERKNYIRQKAEEARLSTNGLNALVAAPDPQLPLSFDNLEIDLHRYRYMEDQTRWMMRPQ